MTSSSIGLGRMPFSRANCSMNASARTRDVLDALAQRRAADGEDVEAEEEVLAEGARARRALARSLFVAARTRTSTWMTCSLPTREISPDCTARSTLACATRSMSPISSRKSVPPCACSKRPRRFGLGAGEGAPLVAEELALDELARDGGAVDLHEGSVGARREAVDGARDELLARCRSRR